MKVVTDFLHAAAHSGKVLPITVEPHSSGCISVHCSSSSVRM